MAPPGLGAQLGEGKDPGLLRDQGGETRGSIFAEFPGRSLSLGQRRPQRLAGQLPHLLQHRARSFLERHHAEIGGTPVGQGDGIGLPKILEFQADGGHEGLPVSPLGKPGVPLQEGHQMGSRQRGVESGEIFPSVGFLSRKEKRGHDLSGSADEEIPGHALRARNTPEGFPRAKARVRRFPVETGQIVQSPFPGKTHQMGHRPPHARRVVFFVGHRHEEQIDAEGVTTFGALFHENRLESQATLHVHQAPAEEIVPRRQILGRLGGQGFPQRRRFFAEHRGFFHMPPKKPGIALGVKRQVFEGPVDLRVHHIEMPRQDHRTVGGGRCGNEGEEHLPSQGIASDLCQEKILGMVAPVGDAPHPVFQKMDQFVFSRRGGDAPNPGQIQEKFVGRLVLPGATGGNTPFRQVCRSLRHANSSLNVLPVLRPGVAFRRKGFSRAPKAPRQLLRSRSVLHFLSKRRPLRPAKNSPELRSSGERRKPLGKTL